MIDNLMTAAERRQYIDGTTHELQLDVYDCLAIAETDGLGQQASCPLAGEERIGGPIREPQP